jgi:subtilisin family serine protease
MKGKTGREPRVAPVSSLGMRTARWARRLGALVPLAWAAASCSQTARQLGTLPQASDTIYVGEMRPAGRAAARSFGVAAVAPSRALITGRRPAPTPHVPLDKIEPALRARVALATPGQRETLIVTFADTLQFPRFALGNTEPHGTNLDVSRQHASEAIARAIAANRATDATALGDSMQSAFGVRPIDHGWLVRSVEIVLPLVDAPRLASRPDVTSIEPLSLTGAPPDLSSCGASLPGAVSWNLGISAYLDANYTGGRIALLDTGVLADHDLLYSCGRLDMLGYCTAPGDRCVADRDLATDYATGGHGTSNAALLVSDGAGNPCMAGLTRAQLDCFRVYRKHTGAIDDVQAVSNAIDRAFRTAMERNDAVILPELDIRGTTSSRAVQAVDKAVTAGFVVVCPVGNDGAGALGSPGLSASVISAGGYAVATGATIPEESYVTDPHVLPKPDLQTPTQIVTARLGGDHMRNGRHADAWEFNGTSGAAPVATALAAILREHLMSSGLPVDAGEVYATLLASARPVLPSLTPGETPAQHGAGRPQLPVAGRIWWGEVDVPAGHDVPISIDPASGAADLNTGTPPGGSGGAIRHLDAAIWWEEPESFDANGFPSDTHNDVNLELVDPNGGKTDSQAFATVWEKVRADVPVGMTGVWTLHVIGDDLKIPVVRVYVAVIGTP